MKHLFIPYDLALIAKEKGFNEECCTYFLNKDLERLGFGHTNDSFEDDEKRVCAPLYQQIIDWFIQYHKLFISVKFIDGIIGYTAVITDLKTNIELFESLSSIFYMDLLNEAIKKAFKLI